MKTIEIRRNCQTGRGDLPGSRLHLSPQGIAQARSIGEQIGPFDLVLTSTGSRTVKTALAMGFTVNEQLEALTTSSTEAWDVWHEIVVLSNDWEQIGQRMRRWKSEPFVLLSAFIDCDGPSSQMARRQRETWTRVLESVPAHGNVLIISEQWVIESGLVSCIPNADFVSWGSLLDHGEGVRMQYEGGRFSNIEFRRMT